MHLCSWCNRCSRNSVMMMMMMMCQFDLCSVSCPWVLMLMMCVRSIHIQHRWHVVFQWLHSRWYCHTSEDAQEHTVCKGHAVNASMFKIVQAKGMKVSERNMKQREREDVHIECRASVIVCEMLTKMLLLTICDFLLIFFFLLARQPSGDDEVEIQCLHSCLSRTISIASFMFSCKRFKSSCILLTHFSHGRPLLRLPGT